VRLTFSPHRADVSLDAVVSVVDAAGIEKVRPQLSRSSLLPSLTLYAEQQIQDPRPDGSYNEAQRYVELSLRPCFALY